MKKILREKGVPEDVVYIALIESGFTGSARSHASAVGFWQFIGSTGRNYGLRIDPYVDERQCFVKSTYAAANYMTDLYRMFGDWYLAFAGYNSGEGKVQRAIKMYGTKDFWKLTTHKRRYFRPETKDYVPKYIAAAMIARNPRKYGFSVDYHEPLDYDEVKAATQTDFEIIAKASRSDYPEIALLNPHLLMGVTPPDARNYTIRVPAGKGSKFLRAFAKIPKRKRITKNYSTMVASRSTTGYHKVRRGETLSRIARKYRVSTRALMKANRIKKARHLRRGQRLKIPGKVSKIAYNRKKSVRKAVSSAANSSSSTVAVRKSAPKKAIKYRIRRGDTLGGIANKHNITIADIKRWNKIRGNRVVIGKRLKIYQGGTSVSAPSVQVAAAPTKTVTKTKNVKYKVKSGDTLGAIARRNGVKVSDLKKWNGLKSNNIGIGKSLVVKKKKVQVSVPVVAMASDTVAPIKSSPRASYKIKKGDTWWSIAKRNKTTVAKLKKLNPKVGKYLKVGKKVRLSGAATGVAAATPAKPKAARPAVAANKVYKVKSGDTLYGISLRTKTSISDLCAANNISRSAVLRPGMKLKVKSTPSKSAVMARKSSTSDRMTLTSVAPIPSPTASMSTVKYKVKKGDTAWNIAKKHKVSLSQIKGWNNGTDLTKIKPGDTIKLQLASKKKM
jgi:membrane-bound lytic murein transglycosylase D